MTTSLPYDMTEEEARQAEVEHKEIEQVKQLAHSIGLLAKELNMDQLQTEIAVEEFMRALNEPV